jgi:hypothetical protein
LALGCCHDEHGEEEVKIVVEGHCGVCGVCGSC